MSTQQDAPGQVTNLATSPERAGALDRDFAELLNEWNRGATDGPAIFDYEYLLVVARTHR